MKQHGGKLTRNSGRWTFGLATTPGVVIQKGKIKPRIILPNVPDRRDVPAPPQTPWAGVALLNLYSRGNLVLVGTGFLCQPDVLVTARHNLKSVAFDAAGIWMAFDTRLNPHGMPVTIRAYAVHPVLDVAALILSSPQYGTFELGGQVPAPPNGLALAGYGLPYPDLKPRLSYGIGPVTRYNADRIDYLISTREGDSGAPVFTMADGIPRAIGMHIEGASDPQTGNEGLCFSSSVVQEAFRTIAQARSYIQGESK